LEKRKLVVQEIERIRTAQTLGEVRHMMNNDRFFEFTEAYRAATGRSPGIENEEREGREYVTATLDLLEQGLELASAMLTLDPADLRDDWNQIQALQQILRQTDAASWTPLQRILGYLNTDLNARLSGKPESNQHHRLVVFA